MKAIVTSTVMLAMTAGGIVLGWQIARYAGGASAAIALPAPTYRFQSQALKIEQIRQLGELVTLDVPVSDVQTSTLEGLTGSASLVLLVRGNVLIGTDLEQATFADLDAQGRTATLVLPPPRTMQPRLDHARTVVYRSDRTGLWQLFPTPGAETAVYERAMKQAQRLLEEAADQPELIERARERTEAVLRPFFEALGWAVVLQWTDMPRGRAGADDDADAGKIMP